MKSFTKELMVEAIKELLKSRPFSKITVNEIVSLCGASKQTFYNHFQDKYALFTYAVAAVVHKNLQEAERCSTDYRTCILNYYKLILEERDFYRAAIRDDTARDLIFECIRKNSGEYFRTHTLEQLHITELDCEMELAIRFNAVGNAQLLVDWIRSGMETPPETMAAVNYTCIPEPLKFIK